MRGSITIAGAVVDLNSDLGQAFVTDACRSAEGLICDKDLVEIYSVDPAELVALSKDPQFAKALRAERDRRVRSNTAVREAASRHFVKAPNVLDSIMSDNNANARHRIEAIREMRAVALPSSDAPASQADRIIISIDLGGGHIEKFDEARTIDVAPDQPPQVNADKPGTSEQPKLVEQPRRRGRPPKLKVIEQGSENSDE